MDNVPSANVIVLTAAGGWVLNEANEVLWIHRMGQWDLPKGKLEAGESIPQCAVREVEEECGLAGIELVSALCETVHSYPLDDATATKTTHWFLMRVAGTPALTPQKSEGISRAEWIPQEDAHFLAGTTYATLQEVEEAAHRVGASRRGWAE